MNSYIANQYLLENPNCPLCGNKEFTAMTNVNKHNYVKCLMCELVYLRPRLTEKSILDYYSSETFYSEYSSGSGYEIQENALRITFRKLLQRVSGKILLEGSLLEVGCGYGYFLDEAKKYFSSAVGTDFSKEAVSGAKKYNQNVFCGGLEAVPREFSNFDVVTNFAVLEHVYDPLKFIEDIKNKMNKGGKLIIATPYAGGFWYRILGKRWPFFIYPEHVCLYDKKSLEELLRKCDFADVETFTTEHAWPLAVIVTKMGAKKIGLFLSKTRIGRVPIAIPGTIICAIAGKLAIK